MKVENNDLISAIVPVYNVENYLKQCLESIINQTYQHLEIILIDDGSLDNSGKICDEFASRDARIKVFHKKNEGVSSARNTGIENASGKWIAFIDSDDWIEKEYFETMMNYAKSEDASVVLCAYNKIWGNEVEKINVNSEKKEYNANEYLIKTLNPQTGFGFCHMKLIKKECIGDLRFNQNLVVGEDALFNIQLSKNIKKAFFCDSEIYNYRNNSNSVVKRYDQNYANKYLKSMKVNKDYLLKNYKETEILQNYYNFVAYHVMLVAINFCYNTNNKEKHKRKLVKQICNYDEFKEGIEKSNYNNISLTRKIMLFTLKRKMYFCTGIICKFRQMQNRRK